MSSPTTTEPHAKGEFGEPAPRPSDGPGLWHQVRKVLKVIGSLRATVVLFLLGMGLIFFGTVAQLDNGIWTVVGKYFWSWKVDVPLDLFRKFLGVFCEEQFPAGGTWEGTFPFPGGILIGVLMVINLVAAHLVLIGDLIAGAIRQSARGVSLKKSLVMPLLKRTGIYLIHGGLLLLFAGEAITREYAVEQRMTINQGESTNYTEDNRHIELAYIDHSDSQVDHVVVIPASVLKEKRRVSSPDLPFDVETLEYMPNSLLVRRAQVSAKNLADKGAGLTLKAESRPEVSGVDPNQQVDLPSAYIQLYKKGTDEKLGSYLVSLHLNSDEVEAGGKQYEMSLRFKRYYKPYRVYLEQFRFDRFTGTQKARNYSSDVKVFDESGKEIIPHQHIAMNEPLRYNGETFYQSSFDPRTEKTTILQVVQNPAWMLPYAACVVVSLGLVIHFLVGLIKFLKRTSVVRAAQSVTVADVVTAAAAEPPAMQSGKFVRVFPWAMLALTALYLLSVTGRMTPKSSSFDYDTAARMRVLDGGRVKPLDTVARVALRLISGREEFIDPQGNKQPAIRWYLDTITSGSPDLTERGKAFDYRVIRIDNEQVLLALGLEKREGYRYSMKEIWPKIKVLQERVAVQGKPGQKPDTDARKFKEAAHRVQLYLNVVSFGSPPNEQGKYEGLQLLPPEGKQGWRSLREYRDTAMATSVMAGAERVRQKIAPKLSELGTKEVSQLLGALGMDPGSLTPDQFGKARERLIELLQTDPEGLPPQMRRLWLDTALTLVSPEEQTQIRAVERDATRKLMAADPAASSWEAMLAAYRDNRPNDFARAIAEYDGIVAAAGVPDRVEPKSKLEWALFAPWNALGHNRVEIVFNRFAPFYQCAGLYVIAFVLALAGFTQLAAGRPAWASAFRRSAFLILMLTFLIHAVALFARMYLMERPLVFVTNLYSSAIFIGLGCVGLCLIIERIFPLGVGNVLAAMLGLTTTIVAHNLVAEDTLEMMQAVLDTNFWLATHVTTVTLGYTATFVAGFLGALYVLQMLAAVVRDSFQKPGEPTVGDLLAFGTASLGIVGIPLFFLLFLTNALTTYELVPRLLAMSLFFVVAAAWLMYALALMLLRVFSLGTNEHGRPVAGEVPRIAAPVAALALTPERGKVFGQMVYGVVCFATLLSFVGTVLGGIWADQSWGRFWGWDPKENGAVLIVLWNALILHARWAGLVKDRGVAVLAIVGNCITAWSWFGTNQLQVGLHAYGFDSRLADGCFNFWASQCFILALGLIPRHFWSQAPAAALAAATDNTAASRGRGARRDRRR